MIERDAEQDAALAGHQRVGMIAEPCKVEASVAIALDFPPRRPITAANSSTRCSGSRSRPVSWLKISRSSH